MQTNKKLLKRHYKAVPLKDLTQSLVKRSLGDSASSLLTLMRVWQDIIPADLRHTTRARQIRFPDHRSRRNGILELDVQPEVAFIAEYAIPQLIDAANVYFGYPAISRITIRQVNFETITEEKTKTYEPTKTILPAAGIKDSELAELLAHWEFLVKKRSC